MAAIIGMSAIIGCAMNIFFDVDGTIVGSYDDKLRPMVREVFERLGADGDTIYIWSGVGLRWREIDLHGLRPLIATCFWKPRWDHHARLAELGVDVVPDFVVDDHREVVAAFGGVTVRPFDYYDPSDREMERVYRVISVRVSDRRPGDPHRRSGD
jgi:hypothetical protein